MSLQNKGFWMVKGSGHNSDRETAFDNPSKTEPKRPRQWFVDPPEVDFLQNKKQAVEDTNEKSSSGISNANFTPWENGPNFHQVSNSGLLFGSETRPVNFTENNTYVSADGSNVRSKMITNQFGNESSFGLSISQSLEDSEACMNFGGIKKVRVNQVKDFDVQVPAGHNVDRQSIGDLHEAYGEAGTRSAPTGKAFDKDGNLNSMGLSYSRGDAHVRSFGAPFGKADNTVISVGESYNKEDTNIISFGGFPGERDIIPVSRDSADYEQLYNQSSVLVSTTAHEKKLDSENSDAVANAPLVTKMESETGTKNKEDIKTAKKDGPYCFPSNVRSLITTGMLDGVPVKYVSVAREELRGIIKGSGYLCGCQPCNYSKALNAYEFERHAGCKSKHPNNHIYFENGKTIYQIVQELKSTPQNLLFDTIQTIFGAPINQKAFRNWKESFQAATRELQRIYGKDGF